MVGKNNLKRKFAVTRFRFYLSISILLLPHLIPINTKIVQYLSHFLRQSEIKQKTQQHPWHARKSTRCSERKLYRVAAIITIIVRRAARKFPRTRTNSPPLFQHSHREPADYFVPPARAHPLRDKRTSAQ